MTTDEAPEVWLRGPIEGVDPMVMPVAHALLQVREDAAALARRVDEAHVWSRPGGAASIGFHLRHAGGALDRLFTYARGESLTADQLARLQREGDAGTPPVTIHTIVAELDATIERALDQLRRTEPEALRASRAVGRRRLPSTTLGLLFHAAEHSTRHVGQAITTARILSGA